MYHTVHASRNRNIVHVEQINWKPKTFDHACRYKNWHKLNSSPNSINGHRNPIMTIHHRNMSLSTSKTPFSLTSNKMRKQIYNTNSNTFFTYALTNIPTNSVLTSNHDNIQIFQSYCIDSGVSRTPVLEPKFKVYEAFLIIKVTVQQIQYSFTSRAGTHQS